MIVVKISKDESEAFSKCASFVGKRAKSSFGKDFKIIANSESFQVISDFDKQEKGDLSVELTVKKTINFDKENIEEVFKKLDFFMKNANKIMDTIIDGDE
mgnify:CR=1 FL=1